jgi:DNA-binding transcriptional LysR family regulator
LLPTWQLPGGGIHAVFPASRFMPQRARAFIDLLREHLAATRLPR